MKGLDFANFKKTAQDKASATLRHPDGHEIKIAIAGLKPEMRKKLAELPLHQAEPEAPVEAMDPDSPAPVQDTPTNNAAPEAVAPPPVAASPVGGQSVGIPDATPPLDTPPAVAATTAPLITDAARVAQTPLLAGETPEQHYAKEVAFQQDLANRHITPETYQSLFAKKDTLGKIGTIFGLMLSGIGSGLTKQPNAALDMMNKEIDRDLDAQKTSKANANTFLNTQYAHDMQEANMLHLSNQNALTQQQILESKAKTAGLGQKNEAINKQITNQSGGHFDDSIEKQNALIGVDSNAKNKMLSTVAQHLDDITPNNPAAKQMLQTTIKPAIDAEIKKNVIDTGAKRQAATAIKNAQNQTAAQNTGQSVSDVIDMDKYHAMLDRGKLKAQNGGVFNSKTDIDPNDDADIKSGITNRTQIENNYNSAMANVKELMAMPNAGESMIGKFGHAMQGTPYIGGAIHAATDMLQGSAQRPRDQLIDSIKQRLAAAGAGEQQQNDLVDALSPSRFDTPETAAKIPGIVLQHFNQLKEAHPGVFQKYGLDSDIPEKKIDVPALLKEAKGKEVTPGWAKKTFMEDMMRKGVPNG